MSASGTSFTIDVDGAAMPARPGQTVAAALIAAGRTGFRSTARSGAPRGVFCGIGVCMDCVVEIDGLGVVPSCREPARPGMRIRTQSI